MDELFNFIKFTCHELQIISDFIWDFPTNFIWYKNLPILGNFSLAIIMLLGSGVYFTFRLKFVQIRYFKKSFEILKERRICNFGISPLASFFLSTAMRVGSGNIIGVTGAISVGGPGALFWMWASAFFGMATAFCESTLTQIFKEKHGNEYVGGISFYGKRLLWNSSIIGVCISLLYIIYALLVLPSQGFNLISSLKEMAGIITGEQIPINSTFIVISSVILIIAVLSISFGNIKKITRITDILVPIMAVLYLGVVFILILLNFDRVPYFFYAVFKGAFSPEAIFGGAFGVALVQGIKRGLMSNEAGQGTLTMSAAVADAKHPCDQGLIQSMGVFLDTIVICTFTGFVVVMARLWESGGASAWMAMDKLPKFIASGKELAPNAENFIALLFTFSFGLFVFTCVLAFISFSKICAARISKSKLFINFITILSLLVMAFGIGAYITGLDLAALWQLSDLANILMVFANIPLLHIGFKYVKKSFEHYEKGGDSFDESVIGTKLECWEKK